MDSAENRELYHKFENQVLHALRQNAIVEVSINIAYPTRWLPWRRAYLVPYRIDYEYRANFPKIGWTRWIPFISGETKSAQHTVENL